MLRTSLSNEDIRAAVVNIGGGLPLNTCKDCVQRENQATPATRRPPKSKARFVLERDCGMPIDHLRKTPQGQALQ